MAEMKRRIVGVLALALGSMTAVAPSAASANSTLDFSLLHACPIEGEHDLHDSYGWPRSGGRRHQGIDIAAPRGTELYAVRDGVVDFKHNRLGGKALWLTADDGDDFYYAHLDAFVGEDRRVQAGELIGYVGSTGNAGSPHLHFEVHPGGSVTNPFEAVVEACTRPDSTERSHAPDADVTVAGRPVGDRTPASGTSSSARPTTVRPGSAFVGYGIRFL